MWGGQAEHHNEVAFVDDEGKLLVKQRITDDAAGFRQLLELLTAQPAVSSKPISVAIETSRGLMPAAIIAAGFTVYAINPLSVSRYRDRHSPSRAKSDAADAMVLANILRTDRDNHRAVPADSELVQSWRVRARAQQDAVWDRQQIANKLRSLLREFYRAFLACFPDLTLMGARVALGLAPSPARARTLRKSSVAGALRRGGRTRGVDAEAERIVTGLRQEQLHQLQQVEDAMSLQAQAYLRALNAAIDNLTNLEAALTTAFDQHPDKAVITSFPGLGVVLGGPPPRRDRRRPDQVRRRPWVEGIRRHRSGDASQWTENKRHHASRPRQASAPGCLPLDAAAAHPIQPAPERTTTGAAPAETATARPPATSETVTSGCSTTACKPGSATTRTKPSRHRQLDVTHMRCLRRPHRARDADRAIHLLRSPQSGAARRAVREAQLRTEVARVHRVKYGVYGARKVWMQLHREDIDVARCTVERLMRELGLSGARRGGCGRGVLSRSRTGSSSTSPMMNPCASATRRSTNRSTSRAAAR